MPSSCLDETLTVATWNVRELGRRRRSEAAIHYVAEIVRQFDLVGLVELRRDLRDLERVLEVLGAHWKAILSEPLADPGGNQERVAYLYDARQVEFTGLAGSAEEPRRKREFEYLPERSFWRKPYLASFRAGSYAFVALTTHVRWGESGAAREGELGQLADWIEAKRRAEVGGADLLVLGDFNVPRVGDRYFQAITKHGLRLPEALAGLEHGSNLEKDKRYDQILHYPGVEANFTGRGGVLDFFGDDRTIEQLFPGEGLTRLAFTYQVSDHLPLWIELRTDRVGEALLRERAR